MHATENGSKRRANERRTASRRFRPSTRHGVAWACLAIALAGLPAGPLLAQTATTFVSTTSAQVDASSSAFVAQNFRTGSNDGGYTLSSVVVHLGATSGRSISVNIRENTSNNRPGTLVATLSNPNTLTANSINTFTAPADTTLNKDTRYWISLHDGIISSDRVVISSTHSDDETGETGWNIGNGRVWRDSEEDSWTQASTSVLIAVKGPARQNTAATGAPGIDGTPQVGQTLTATDGTMADDDELPTTTFPDGYAFQWVLVDGATETDIADADSQTYVPVPGDVGKTIKVKVSFTDGGDTEETLTSAATQTVAAAPEDCATDRPGAEWCTQMTVVSVRQSTGTRYGYSLASPAHGSLDKPAIVHGATTYDVHGLWIWDADGGGSDTVTVDFQTGRVPHGTAFDFGGTTFAAASNFEHPSDDTRYRWPRPADFAWLDGQTVTVSANLPPVLTGATVKGAELVLIYHENLDTGSIPATSLYSVAVDGGTGTAPSNVTVSGRKVTLTLASAVKLAQTVTVTYTVPASNPVQDGSGIDAHALTNEAVINTTGAAPVSADWALKPSAVVEGDLFRLIFATSTTRNATSTDIADYNTFVQNAAAAGHTAIRSYSAGFRVVGCTASVDARNNTSTTHTSTDTGVPIYWLNGAKVADDYADFYDGSWDNEANPKNQSGTNRNLTNPANQPFTGCDHDGTRILGASALDALGRTLSRLGKPGSSGSADGPISSSTSGSGARPFYGLSQVFVVSDVAIPTNTPPEFNDGDSTSRGVHENQPIDSGVGRFITATDADDDPLTYSLEGTDADSFRIGASNGWLRTQAVFDHETRSSYSITAKVDDGNGGTDTIAVTVNVNDRAEQPLTPAAPTVNGTTGNRNSLEVRWTKPGLNGGPDIVGYKLQYRTGGGAWTELAQTFTGLTHTIGGLAEDTAYDVQVRALNGETPSEWSMSGTGTTGVTPTNTAPAFDEGPSTTREVPENTPAGAIISPAVGASDDDNDTLTYSLEGADAASFDIRSDTGHLRTMAELDYETRTSYSVTVKADDGNGGTATIAVTVNVIDIAEKSDTPAAPSVRATANTTDSVDVAWTAPGLNGGPAIVGYILRFRVAGVGAWSERTPPGADTTYTIDGLAEDTTYAVQVRARNGEIDSDWSLSGTGSTGSATNRDPEFAEGAGATRRVAEHAALNTAVGAPVSATDEDGDTLTYRLQGADAGSFAIGSATGQIRTAAALDYETRTSYSVTVEADDGNGGTATIDVTIEIVDVDENPPVLTIRAISRSVAVGGDAQFEIRRQGGDMGWLKYSRRVEEADGFVTTAWGSFRPGETTKDLGVPAHAPGTMTVRVMPPSDPPCASPSERRCTDHYDVGSPSSASITVTGSLVPQQASVSGTLLTLRYPQPLDRGSAPDPKDWVVRAAGGSGARTLPIAAVTVRGEEAVLALTRPAAHGETVTVSYLPWAMHPLRGYPDGPDAAPLTELRVRNDTGLTPGGPIGDEAALAARYPGAAPESSPGTAPPVPWLAESLAAAPTRLDLADRGLTDVEALAGAAELETLDLSGNALADAWPLATLPSLRRLDLSGNRVSDVAPLVALSGLETLDLGGNGVSDVSALAALTNLRRLDLSGNRISDVAPLVALSGLEVLDLSGNGVSDVSALAALANLRRLDLSGNAVSDAAALVALSGLEVLVLDGNAVADPGPLGHLPRLARLDLSGNRVSEAALLTALGSLERLDLSDNRIAWTAPLGELSALIWLDLRANPVSEVSALGQLQRLRWLWLDPAAPGPVETAPPDGSPSPLLIESGAPARISTR